MTGGIDHAKLANSALANAELDWEAGAPRSIFFDDIYYAGDGAGQARHVFIDGNDLAARFPGASRFSIGELGFGAGLNLLAAWDLWRGTQRPSSARLEFLSFEKFPIAADALARVHSAWPQFSDLSRALRAAMPPATPGVHRLRLSPEVSLTLCLGDAALMLSRVEARIDAWFLDGFAPSKNPDMWTQRVFEEVARLSAPGATAATFTVAGDVRRALEASGFEVEKRPGFGRKREMLTARRAAAASRSRRAPWFANANLKPLAPGAAIAVIGGGVAGASLAHELGAAGFAPTLIDPLGIAAGASGNPAGLIMPRLDFDDSPAARFLRTAYVHALGVVTRIEAARGEAFFNRCGVHLRAITDEDRDRQEKILAARLLPEEFALAKGGGLFFPQAGVIDPAAFCRALAHGAPLITRAALSISTDDDAVSISLDGGEQRSFDAAIIANGREALRFVGARSLPFYSVPGQIDIFPDAPAPAHASVFGQYAAPAPGGGVAIGATYDRVDAATPPAASRRSTIENIAAVASVLPDLAAMLDADAAQPRAGMRCQTPDHLPVAGPLPDWNFYSGAYDDLRFGKRRDYQQGEIAPRLFILSGLGSRGLATAPYCAALMVSEMCGAPFEREIAEALHPARFFIRDLKRSRRIVAR